MALPGFLLFGFVYGLSFDIAPPNTAESVLRAAKINLVYVGIWLVYWFACVKWPSRLAAWVFLGHWLCTAAGFCLIYFGVRGPGPLQCLAVPPLLLALALNGLYEKLDWGVAVHGGMLLLGAGALLYLYAGGRGKPPRLAGEEPGGPQDKRMVAPRRGQGKNNTK